jgi:type I restriction enzyme S subunit
VDFRFIAGADGVKIFKPIQEFLPKLFYYFLQAIDLPNKGYARHFQYLEKSYINIPPLDEQQRIVAKIEELFTQIDAGFAALERARARLKRYRQAVTHAAVTGKLTEEWKNRNDDNDTQNYTNQPFHIPKGWALAKISDVTLSMKNGIYKPSKFYNEEGIACLRMYNIEDGHIVWKDIKRMSLTTDEMFDYELLPGDILVNRVNSRELVGKSAVIPENIERSVYESKNIRLRVDQTRILSKFLNIWMQHYGRLYFNFNAQQVVGMASINQIQLGNMPISIPGLDIQQSIIEEIEHRFSIAEETNKAIKQSLHRASRLRQAILQRAFSGKLV